MFEGVGSVVECRTAALVAERRRPLPRLELGFGVGAESGFAHEPSGAWTTESLARRAVEWLDEPPGDLLAGAIEDTRNRLDQISDEDVLRLVTGTERLTSWVQAVQLDAIAELLRRPGLNPSAKEALDQRALTVAEVGCALGLTRYSAERRVDLADTLAVDFPATLAALREGLIDKQRAQVISDELGAVPDLSRGERAAIEQRALDGAVSRTGPQIRDGIRRALQAHNPDSAAQRHQRRRRERCVRTMPLPDAMGELWGYLPAETISTIETVLNGLADTHRNDRSDPRTHDERRADVLGDIFTNILDGQPLPRLGTMPSRTGRERTGSDRTGSDTTAPDGTAPDRSASSGIAAGETGSRAIRSSPTRSSATGSGATGFGAHVRDCAGGSFEGFRWWMPPSLPTRKGRRPHLVITIAASTLAGTDDQPATLAGYGPVPADLARQLAATASTTQTACFDPHTGACLSIGTLTPYRPSQAILDQVTTRDPVCRYPGCRRPATQCDIDHVIRHPAGPTCPCNLIPLCRSHHRLKHDGGWRVERSAPRPGPGGAPTPNDSDDPPGTVSWTSRLGRRYTDPPTPLMPPAPPADPRSPTPSSPKSDDPLPIEPPF